MVTVHYWASARAAAGRAHETMDAATIGDLVAQWRQRPALDRIVGASSLLVDGIAASVTDTERSLDGVTEVHVLPPFAGG